MNTHSMHDRPRFFSALLTLSVAALLLARWPNAIAQDGPATTEPARAADAAPTPATTDAVQPLVRRARKSIVVISYKGRDGQPVGVGTGFVVAADGLIATNLHVIGEARDIIVRTANGKDHAVTEVAATDRHLDLALIRIAAKNLPALELGDSDKLEQGQAIVVMGNPLGLEHSVVTGVISGTRTIGERPMIQIAMPVEPGNSGGPVLDMQGRVHGVVTLKSAVTRNLGFAMPVNALKPMIARPNPIAMDKWLTIGAMDARQWQTLFGATWRQRAGRIVVEHPGAGFGGRALCLRRDDAPDRPYEVAVTVKLDDEAGAAGLAFCADGGDKHYGFYPTGGRLRLTRFDGPSVFTWKVLHDEPSDAYRPGEWNTIKVRLEADRMLCYVNDELVVESRDDGLTAGRIGLAKFRETRAEFRGFRVGEKLPPSRPSDEQVAAIRELAGDVPADGELGGELVERFVPHDASGAVLAERANELERQAEQLRRLASAVHGQRVIDEIVKLFERDEADVDVFHAALLLAKLDNEEVDVQAYREELGRMAEELRAMMPDDAPPVTRRAMLNEYLFEQNGFHGGRTNYYSRSNSYMNEVMDDREGLPITLSVLYMALGRRVGLKLDGAALPGHFMVRDVTEPDEPQLIDPFEGGKLVTREEAAMRVLEITGVPMRDEHLTPPSKRDIIIRMLHNLMGVAREQDPIEGPLPYLDALIALRPDAGQERWVRAVLRYQSGRYGGAVEDANWLIEHEAEGVDLGRVRELIEAARRAPR